MSKFIFDDPQKLIQFFNDIKSSHSSGLDKNVEDKISKMMDINFPRFISSVIEHVIAPEVGADNSTKQAAVSILVEKLPKRLKPGSLPIKEGDIIRRKILQVMLSENISEKLRMSVWNLLKIFDKEPFSLDNLQNYFSDIQEKMASNDPKTYSGIFLAISSMFSINLEMKQQIPYRRNLRHLMRKSSSFSHGLILYFRL